MRPPIRNNRLAMPPLREHPQRPGRPASAPTRHHRSAGQAFRTLPAPLGACSRLLFRSRVTPRETDPDVDASAVRNGSSRHRVPRASIPRRQRRAAARCGSRQGVTPVRSRLSGRSSDLGKAGSAMSGLHSAQGEKLDLQNLGAASHVSSAPAPGVTRASGRRTAPRRMSPRGISNDLCVGAGACRPAPASLEDMRPWGVAKR